MQDSKSKSRIIEPRYVALVAITAVVAYVLYCMTAPFAPALIWALALAVSAHPLHQWLRHRIRFDNVAAGIAVFTLAVAIVLPVTLVSRRLVKEAGDFIQIAQQEIESGGLHRRVEQLPKASLWLPWLESQVGWSSAEAAEIAGDEKPAENRGSADDKHPEKAESADDKQTEKSESPKAPSGNSDTINQAASMVTSGVGTVITGLSWMIGQLFVTFLALFFFLRDRDFFVSSVRQLIPFTETETDQLFERIDDTIYATIYGSLTVAAIQGTMGGLIFWYLGLPSPLLWGAIMGLLAVVPVLGTFVIWGPTALYLASQGNWTDALILTAWGGIAIALVDNFIYPYLVGSRMNYHTLLVFLAMVGGLASFGASGIIIGPLMLGITDGLIKVWLKKSAAAELGPADAPAA